MCYANCGCERSPGIGMGTILASGADKQEMLYVDIDPLG